ncbi:MAG: InlB B-repeat-containing protein [Eubacterium sp.]|nr:InlB B-repeat-containing protein [Eubacterium sp.]
MMRRMKNAVLGVVLSLCMASSCMGGVVPTVVSAAGSDDVFGTLYDGKYTLESKTYTLTEDVATSGRIVVPSGVTATVDLAGHKVDRGLTNYVDGGGVFGVEEGATLTVKNGTVTGGARGNGNGGGFNVNGSLVLEDVTVTGNKAESAGGGIFINRAGASVKLSGNCVITDNSAGEKGGGIYVDKSAGTSGNQWALSVEDTIVVKNNIKSNLYLSEGKKIDITSTLKRGTSIGVTQEDACETEFTAGYSMYNTMSPDTYFQGDGGQKVILKNGQAWLTFTYVDRSWNATENKVDEEVKRLDSYISFDDAKLNGDTQTVDLEGGKWYVLNHDTRFQHKVRVVNGTANILLCDGKKLICEKGIAVCDENALNIYGQEADTGRLECDVYTYNSNKLRAAGIGCDSEMEGTQSCGDINIYGGDIFTHSGYGAAGIGGCNKKDIKNITIYGGKINSLGGHDGAGIGTGFSSLEMKGSITIHGGDLLLYGGDTDSADGGAAGIGVGYGGKMGGTVTITGGNVKAYATRNAAGIGTARNGDVTGKIEITGGKVHARGQSCGAGIGTTNHENYDRAEFSGQLIVTGGEVTAESGTGQYGYTIDFGPHDSHSRAIGGGENAKKFGSIDIGDDMSVTANGTVAGVDERVEKCQIFGSASASAIVVIKKCDHANCICEADPSDEGKHIKTCLNCKYSASVPHVPGPDGKCTECGVAAFKTYTVSFNSNGGTDVATQTVESGKTAVKPVAPTREGYSFMGWKLGGKAYTFTETVSCNITLEATWELRKLRVSFDTDGGSTVAPATVGYGGRIYRPVEPTKEGYTFEKWQAEGKDYDFSQAIKTDLTLKAVWKVNRYTITFDTDGAGKIEAITQDYDTAITAPANPTKEGYTFSKWDQTIPAKMPAKNMTITALWTIKQYTITFDTDGGSTIAPITQDYGSVVSDPADPTKQGATFNGWTPSIPATMPARDIQVKANWLTNPSGSGSTPAQTTIRTVIFAPGGDLSNFTDTVANGGKITKPADPKRAGYNFVRWEKNGVEYNFDSAVNEDFTLTAVWTSDSYMITFDTAGGSSMAPIRVKFGEKIPAIASPTKSGSTFAGWEPALPETMPAKDLHLKAKWTGGQYTIIFESDLGVVYKKISQAYGTPVSAPEDPTWKGRTFDAWDMAVPGKMPAEDLTIRAMWTLNRYSITFDTDGGSEIAPISFYYDQTIELPENPVKSGYVFDGWTPKLPDSMPDQDLTVKAKWKKEGTTDPTPVRKKIKATVKKKNVTLKWETVAGATSYTVYTKNKKKWKKLKTLKKKTYTVKNLGNNKTYTYLVRATVKKKLTPIETEYRVKVKVCYNPVLKAAKKKGKAILTWCKVNNAKKYRVFKYVKKKWKLVKTLKKQKYTIKTKSGKTYQFAVKALVGKKWTKITKVGKVKVRR